jgi:hypothetical protein
MNPRGGGGDYGILEVMVDDYLLACSLGKEEGS